ncbi:MAG: hypothetical protein ACYTKC_08790 [Planctomycetota bacterium]
MRTLLAALLLAVLNSVLMWFVFFFHTGGGHGPGMGPSVKRALFVLVIGGGLAAGAGWAVLVRRLRRKAHTPATHFVIATVATQGAAVLATLPAVVAWPILLSARNWHELLGMAVIGAAVAGVPAGLLLASLDELAAWVTRRKTSTSREPPAENLLAASAPIRRWPFVALAIITCVPAWFLWVRFMQAYLVLAGLWLAVVIWLAVGSIRRTGTVTAGLMLWGALVAQAEAILATVVFGRLGAGQNPDDNLIVICVVTCVGGGFILGLLAWGAGLLARPRSAGASPPARSGS